MIFLDLRYTTRYNGIESSEVSGFREKVLQRFVRELESDLRQVDPRTGEVLEQLELPPGAGVSRLESDSGDQFFRGGGSSGKVRTVRRPRRGSAAGSEQCHK
jgi:hypothetical protein